MDLTGVPVLRCTAEEALHRARDTSLRRLRLRVLDRAPDAFGGEWHVEVLDAVFRKCVEHVVDDGGKAAGAAGFAAAFGAQRIGLCRHRMVADRHYRDV